MTLVTTNTHSTEQVSPALVNENTFQVVLFNTLRKHVTAMSALYKSDEVNTLESICGPVFWSSLSDGDKRLAGRYMSQMVDKNMVPYEFAGKCCQSPLVYSVIL